MTKIATVLVLAALTAYAAPGPCTAKSAAYNGYKILQVEVKNPIGFITPWASLSTSLKKGLKLKTGGAFSSDSFNQDNDYLSAALKAQFVSTPAKVKLSYATGRLEACDTDDHTLHVVYATFTSVVPSLVAPSIEQETSESQRPATTGATRASESGPLVAPLTGYNQTLGTWGGLNFSDTVGKLRMQGETEISADSQVGHFDMGSSIGSVEHFWNRADWAATFEYLDTPAGPSSFEEGKLTARFTASTKESTKQRVMLRYGASLEGGHQQSETTNSVKLTPNSGYGALKLYAGATGRPGNGAFTASYGLQLGSMSTSGVPVFKKHLLDLGYNCAFPVPPRKPLGDRDPFKGPLSAAVHRTLGLETRFTAGLIQDAAGAPLAERFLGGNEVRPFVQDDSWVIQSDAFIRSIPENQLGALSGTALGGSRFYSANATVSFTVWGKPMLPKELAEDSRTNGQTAAGTGFPDVLNAPFSTAAAALANSYKTKDPEYIRKTAALPAKAGDLAKDLTALSGKLQEIPSAVAAQPAVSRYTANIKLNLISTRVAANLIAAKPNPQIAGSLVNKSIPELSDLTNGLTGSLRNASQAGLAGEIDALMKQIEALGAEIQDANNVTTEKYVAQAWQTLAPGHRAIDVFLHELNIYSIAPVAIFDVARVWPVNEGVRYGVGPGLRLSLANANFTVGYAFNPLWVRPEKAGAVFFKLDVTSLF
jgi:hypothetical protein